MAPPARRAGSIEVFRDIERLHESIVARDRIGPVDTEPVPPPDSSPIRSFTENGPDFSSIEVEGRPGSLFSRSFWRDKTRPAASVEKLRENYASGPFGRVSGFFRGAMVFLRSMSRRWVGGPFLGILFPFLGDQQYSLWGNHSLDKSYPLQKEGESCEFGAQLRPNSGALLSVHEHRLQLKMRGTPGGVWLYKKGSSRLEELRPEETKTLEIGDILFVGDEPTSLNRSGFDGLHTSAYRVEPEDYLDPQKGWSIKQLFPIHIVRTIGDYQLGWLMELGVGMDVTEAIDLLQPFVAEIEATGWTKGQKSWLAGRDLAFLDSGNEAAVSKSSFPIYPSLTGLLRRMRENSWKPEESFKLLNAMLEEGEVFSLLHDGPIFHAHGFDAERVFGSLQQMREMGLNIEQISDWSVPLFRDMRDIAGAFEQFSSGLKVIGDSDLEDSDLEEASDLLDTLLELREYKIPDSFEPALSSLVKKSGFSLTEALRLMRGLFQALKRSAEDPKSLDDPEETGAYLKALTSFMSFLQGAGVPSEARSGLTNPELVTLWIIKNLCQLTNWFLDSEGN